MRHFLYVPFTGLGLYGGSRGKRWLRERIRVFKHFVVPSLVAQTNQNFTLWVSWRPEEKHNKDVTNLWKHLLNVFGNRVVFTFNGLCFWDDKFPDDVARERLLTALHHTLGQLINYVGDVRDVLMTIQPSDDCYNRAMVDTVQSIFTQTDYNGVGYTKGYIMDYKTGAVKEYNPKTNPPFYTIRFRKEVFIDPFKHAQFTGPYKSHEYVPDFIKYLSLDERGFLVGTHGENISTYFNHPYGGAEVEKSVLVNFGLGDVKPIEIRYSIRKEIMRRLPYRVQRKLRYLLGERFYSKIYQLITG